MNGYVSNKNSVSLNDECTLIGKDRETEVWCGRLSVSANAFYHYGEKGLKPDIVLAVHVEEYAGEEIMKFQGNYYAITRTYERQDGLIELTGTEKAGLRK